MLIQGVEVSSSAAALLALVLHRAGHVSLSERVGRAVDTGVAGLSFSPNEYSAVLEALADSPARLEPLRERLLADIRGRD